ncbi:MAG: hypothetical protein JW778_06615 [Candidatus Altiarchaeota archaeon]|nr:hypothetical protein [Candidatus Altiarchaeota archaeon]
MIKAGPYILKNMSSMLDQFVSMEQDVKFEAPDVEPELASIKDTFEKFAVRYKNDEELQCICDEFEDYLGHRDNELMERITKELDELVYLRRLETLIKQLRSKGQDGQVVTLT